ncbi:hypothetical protein T261_6965 [Streptomyces lydicus]|nr:hypothetical protein T261_6965 [Streptomyces lydicus]
MLGARAAALSRCHWAYGAAGGPSTLRQRGRAGPEGPVAVSANQFPYSVRELGWTEVRCPPALVGSAAASRLPAPRPEPPALAPCARNAPGRKPPYRLLSPGLTLTP